MTEGTLNLAINTRLDGRYTIKDIIGSGGFGVTYKAYDSVQGKPCALKEFVPRGIVTRMGDGVTVMPVSESKNQLFEHGKERFLEEAEILQRLNSLKSVVSVYDFFQENGTCYFAMEFLEGVTLRQLAKSAGGTLPTDIVMDAVKEVGMVLIQVHGCNIFHRDISPDNIFITYDGVIKLIDFGNAKNLIRNDEEKMSVVLKPGFAPPEQYSSKGKQGTFTDVYALAATMYYVLTGSKLPDVFERKEKGYVRLSSYGIEPYISDAVDRALCMNYRERTQTVNDFLVELRLMEGTGDKAKKTASGISDNWFEPTLPTVSKVTPVIEIFLNNRVGGRYKLPINTNIVIGRSESMAHIVINDMHISKKHCELFYDELSGEFFVVDNSTNGVYVDGKRLERGSICQIKPNTVLALGNNNCLVKVGVINE